ncbi:Ssu72-like family protein [Actinidia rufa]|uniref:RNA polymerase II subunit A C-terminal domain phosphatase SSU72 n=1 Tax=Actinidia rufa TaxID=165716 RepID=A0A7J0FXS5_9ERIC|nr:Ssu72-like family protein [Actinidia rufa]
MKLRYGMVCSSNQNRSMEAHSLLKREGFDVCSYGTGAHVKLPGPSLREPIVYDFGTPYKHMFDDLRRKDPELLSKPRKHPTELIEFFPCNGTNSSKPPGLYNNSGILGPNIGTDLSNHIVHGPTGAADPSMRPRLSPISIIAQSRVV